MPKYLIVIEYAGNNFSAYSPDVWGCVATGKTIEETIKEMKSALEFHFEGENTLPEPKGLHWHIENSDIESIISHEGKFISSVKISTP